MTADRELIAEAERLGSELLTMAGRLDAFVTQLRNQTAERQQAADGEPDDG